MSEWQKELSGFLHDLNNVQQDAVVVLEKKRELLAKNDLTTMESLVSEETACAAQMQECLERREKLLQYAAAEGLPSESIEELSRAVVPQTETEYYRTLQKMQYQTRQLQQHNFTNWVITQRTILHLNQMLEIIATRGKMKSTYAKKNDAAVTRGGSLLDQQG